MSIQNIGMKAYSNAVGDFAKAQKAASSLSTKSAPAPRTSFGDTVRDSVEKVNSMQDEKAKMVKSFASGETQNVHELMITLQKAGLAMKMTSAVRGKVMEAYKELSKTQF